MSRLLLAALSLAIGVATGSLRAQDPASEVKATPSAKPAAAERPAIYDEKADARELVATAVYQAHRDHNRVLVMFGGNWCGWCHKLHTVFRTNSDIFAILRGEYVLAMVDTAAPGADELMKAWDVDRSKGVPYLVVLDGDGKIVTRQETGALEEGDHHDPSKVKAFLQTNLAAPIEARTVLTEALARAASEDKRILLHFGAPWCGWCHKLDDFLASPGIAKLVAKDYLDVKIDTERMPGGQSILEEYCKKPGGIPWTVILDSQGKALVNSDGPQGNIGYPAEPHEIAHFLVMLKQTLRTLSADDLNRIDQALQEAGERIREARAPATQ
jgi:thiol-disulfide isomerase/thioredoxin